ncbi:ribosome silencing factor [Aetokthonos hydrillicola Thurmond2011]|jgi:ribosome-associated protein|uniref:Ribosomal silencing factor RsfS n=1 Tax=Aetokthonos hydrillicola Thurmond2011 TaxID=2712845 RepID=A0AAP5MB10_9CYAN|nr:ribosome silencing factor [Aetokthonos hydrillicola]MBO3461179.1 ribosome silencing factor [Aetokthonos hydrillicola CCALA 1050]MBW4588609.1 ribosome silencing factor [Aetokthonos hydrillicola CCALA 1050]MDR9896284.1 ribosome silencing factor [Aetokthonos hydrillicola Thurmond2011]
MSDYFQTNFPIQSLALTENGVKATSAGNSDDVTRKIALTIADAAADKKGGDILVLFVADVSYLADYFVLITGYSKAQVRAIAEAIEEKVQSQWHRRPLRVEGKSEGSWVLQDYGEVIIHTMMPKEREFYNLEAFWGHGTRIEFPTSVDSEGKATT